LPGQLSGGQQQRVAIARAIVVEPPLVLMDEPLSNLDAKLRLEMRAEIRRIHQLLGCSTIYVTHDQDEALSLADRIVVLRDGEVRQIGTPEDLYARPAHADVAEFMGYRNLIPTTAVPSGNTITVTIGGATMGGTPLETINGRAIAAIRPDDLVATAGGPITATVEAAEYRGRDFYGFARTADGTELFFRSDLRVGASDTVRLAVSAERVLVYAAPA
jgi:putative spermidine/putrescine transport system ATP-binding protein